MIRVHSPGDIVNYVIDWSVELPAGATVTASTCTPDPALTIASNNHTSTTATLTGVAVTNLAVPGTTYGILNHITNSFGEQQDQTLYLYIAGR